MASVRARAQHFYNSLQRKSRKSRKRTKLCISKVTVQYVKNIRKYMLFFTRVQITYTILYMYITYTSEEIESLKYNVQYYPLSSFKGIFFLKQRLPKFVHYNFFLPVFLSKTYSTPHPPTTRHVDIYLLTSHATPGPKYQHSPGTIKLFPVRESSISEIPAGDRKIINLFLQCTHASHYHPLYCFCWLPFNQFVLLVYLWESSYRPRANQATCLVFLMPFSPPMLFFIMLFSENGKFTFIRFRGSLINRHFLVPNLYTACITNVLRNYFICPIFLMTNFI